MQSKETKVFNVDGRRLRFDAGTFEHSFREYVQRNKIQKRDLEDLLAEKAGVSREAVHNWRFEKNGPSDIEMIQKLAEALKVKEWKMFTKSVDGGETVVQLTERQKDALKRVYDGIVEFLFEFNQTNGFNDYKLKFVSDKHQDMECMLYDCVEKKINHLFLILDKEFFDLGKHEVYSEICEYVSENICELFDDISYVYRFESVSEDYYNAMKAINEIIEKYI